MKTIKYVILRMVIPIAAAVASMIILKVFTGLSGGKTKIWLTAIWLVLSFVIYYALQFFVGFKFRAGQMAIITDAISVNMIPDDMGALAKESVEYRFPSGNEYLAYRRLVAGSLNQLSMQLNTFAENRLRVPVLGALIKFCYFVIAHALSFCYDFVLCYTFWRDGKTLFTSAADGVAVYWDSWKRMMNNVLILAIFIIVGMATGFAFIGVIVAVIFSPASGPLAGGLAGIVVGYFFCLAAKVVLDTNLTLRSLDAYFEEAQYADYNSEEYENMCRYSKKYTKLYKKAVNEAFAPAPQSAPSAPPAAGYGNDYSNY